MSQVRAFESVMAVALPVPSGPPHPPAPARSMAKQRARHRRRALCTAARRDLATRAAGNMAKEKQGRSALTVRSGGPVGCPVRRCPGPRGSGSPNQSRPALAREVVQPTNPGPPSPNHLSPPRRPRAFVDPARRSVCPQTNAGVACKPPMSSGERTRPQSKRERAGSASSRTTKANHHNVSGKIWGTRATSCRICLDVGRARPKPGRIRTALGSN